MTYEEVIASLRSLEAEDFDDHNMRRNGPERLREITKSLMALASPERAIPELFAVIERLPNADLGTPGPLVHTLERMDRTAYTAGLVASLRRRPTSLSVWMVNRFLNAALPMSQRQFFLDLIASVAERLDTDEVTRCSAEHYLKYQSSRNA